MRANAIMIALAITLAAAVAQAGERTTKPGYLASPSLEALEKACTYLAEHDNAAVEQMIAAGLVFDMPGGSHVEIVETRLFAVKIRPRGSILEAWVPIEAIAR